MPPQMQSKPQMQSLPSFTEAFSSLSGSNDNSLPPILSRSPRRSHTQNHPPISPATRPERRQTVPSGRHLNTRKRRRAGSRDDYDGDDGDSSSDRSPLPSRTKFIKEEQEYDQLEPSPPPTSKQQQQHLRPQPPSSATITPPRSNDPGILLTSGAPPPSLVRPHAQKRRKTISGLGLDTNIPRESKSQVPTPSQAHTPTVHTAHPSTPISPVVMGFTIQRDDPQAMEQVRQVINIKQRQKAIIESRRGSVAGIQSPLDPHPHRPPKGGSSNDSRRGSTSGLPAGTASAPAVKVVNPTPTSANPPASVSGTGTASVAKRPASGNSPPNGRIGLTPASANQSQPQSTQSVSSSPAAPMPINTSPKSKMTGVASNHPNTNSPTPGYTVPSRPITQRSPQPAQAHAPSTLSNQSMSQSQSQAQQTQIATQGLSALANALPPPPTNSFARRRAAQLGLRNRPADIVISPRSSEISIESSQTLSAHNYKTLQPSIQSAPAVPRPGQPAGRFPMALPSLPPVIGQRRSAVRRTVAGQVPPTPTRLGTQRTASGTGGPGGANVRLSQPSGGSGLSPPTANVPIASSSLVVPGSRGLPSMPNTPNTPATFTRATSHSADKAAFLAPFEQFYDALSDARILKNWFHEQLARVGKVAREAEAQRAELEKTKADLEKQKTDIDHHLQSQVERLVHQAVEAQLRGHREEIVQLKRKLDEYEGDRWERERGTHPSNRHFLGSDPTVSPQAMPANGVQSLPRNHSSNPMASYTFPPVAPGASDKRLSHSMVMDMDRRGYSPPRSPIDDRDKERSKFLAPGREESLPRSQASSPIPAYESHRRPSVSAMRFEPPPRPHRDSGAHNSGDLGHETRDRPSKAGGAITSAHPRTSNHSMDNRVVGNGDVKEKGDNNRAGKTEAKMDVDDEGREANNKNTNVTKTKNGEPIINGRHASSDVPTKQQDESSNSASQPVSSS